MKQVEKSAIKITQEGEIKRFEIHIGGIDSAALVQEISTNMNLPEWRNDLVGVSLKSYSAHDTEFTCSLVFLIFNAFGSVAAKTKALEDLMLDCKQYLKQNQAVDNNKTSRVNYTKSVQKTRPASIIGEKPRVEALAKPEIKSTSRRK
jgi:hypothetical protein